MRIPLSAPDITEAEIEGVTAVLRTPWLSLGPRLQEFEESFASWLGGAHVVAVSSGTSALHLAVRACGIKAEDEVITTPFSFVASVNALLYEGAVPVFVDIDPVSLNMDIARIEAAITPRTRAILVVHLFGHPAPMKEILDIARPRGLAVIEDACEALGAEVDGRKVGTIGDCGVFGFYPNKAITTGEGGLLVTHDARINSLCRSLRNHGRDEDGFHHEQMGYNYRIPELSCALGTAQLRRLDEILSRREVVARWYHRRLDGEPGLIVPVMDLPGARIGWFAYVVRLSERFSGEDRDWILAEMRKRGIGCQRYFAPLHLQPHVAAVGGYRRGDFPVAESVSRRTLALPFFNRLTESEVHEVCEILRELLRARRKPQP